MLAASLQDRPLIPACHVVFNGAPEGFRAAFRKWTPRLDIRSPPRHETRQTVLPLDTAIEALV